MIPAKPPRPSSPRIGRLEQRLAGSLKPIAPRSEFVDRLGSRIHSLRPPAIVKRIENIHFIVLVVAGLLSFGVLIALVLRALADLVRRKPLSRA